MLPEPIGERVLSDISRGERKHGADSLDLVSRKIETVQNRQKRRPPISIDKGMVADDPGSVGRRKRADIRPTVCMQIIWPRWRVAALHVETSQNLLGQNDAKRIADLGGLSTVS